MVFTKTKTITQVPYNDQAALLLPFGVSLFLRTIISLYVKNRIAKIENKSIRFIKFKTSSHLLKLNIIFV